MSQGASRELATIFLFTVLQPLAFGGGPLAVGGRDLGTEGQPFTWDTTAEVQYRTDGGPLSRKPGGAVVMDSPAAMERVASLFQVWEDVPTAKIGYTAAGPIIGVVDGDVDTLAEFDAISGSCDSGSQSPIIFDADGSLFRDLGEDPSVIGFAGPCSVNAAGRILSGIAVLNGIFQDQEPDTEENPELSEATFDAAFIHEFGHFSGLDHAQINVRCLNSCSADEMEGVPTMFPFALGTAMKTISPDDVAWISRLYPEASFSASFGTVSGTILFSDGQSQTQGVNVIARQVDDAATPGDEARRVAVSVVSGFTFTANPGQQITGTNSEGDIFGSRAPAVIGHYELSLPPGTYTVEVESINAAFDGGSSVGPLNTPVPIPGGIAEFWNSDESAKDNPQAKTAISVGAGAVIGNVNIILNGTQPRFDKFEASEVSSSAAVNR